MRRISKTIGSFPRNESFSNQGRKPSISIGVIGASREIKRSDTNPSLEASLLLNRTKRSPERTISVRKAKSTPIVSRVSKPVITIEKSDIETAVNSTKVEKKTIAKSLKTVPKTINSVVSTTVNNALNDEFTSPALEFDDEIVETTPEVVTEPKPKQSETMKQVKTLAIGTGVSMIITFLAKKLF